MEYAGALWRFLCCATQALVQSFTPPLSVVSARLLETGEDRTADVIARLASIEAGLVEELDPDIVVEFTISGTGPYALLSQDWPPPEHEIGLQQQQGEMTPLDRQVVMASREDGEDITEDVKKWLGSGGSCEIPAPVARKSGWGERVTIYFADGKEKVLTF